MSEGLDTQVISDGPFKGLKQNHYRLILADPAWAYEMRSERGYAKSPEAHYETMTPEALRALPVADLAARRCILVMWSTWPHLTQALELMASWGFAYKTGGSWTKRTPNGRPGFGTGFILRSATEPFLIGTSGGAFTGDKAIRNLIEVEACGASVDSALREHSRKPDEIRDICDRLVAGGPALELFATSPWAGRDVWAPKAHKWHEVMP